MLMQRRKILRLCIIGMDSAKERLLAMDMDKILKGEIYYKIISFFHENPTSIDTPRGISTWIGENRQVVKSALLKLAGLKVLNAHHVTSTTGYSYTRDPKIIKKIEAQLKKIKKGIAGEKEYKKRDRDNEF